MGRRGRKSKWDEISGRLEEVRKWRQGGATEAQIAQALGISHETFNKYKNEFPEFLEVLKKGSFTLALEIRGALAELALGGREVKTKRMIRRKDKHGNVISTEEIIDVKELPPNAFAALKMLGNLDRTFHTDPDNYEIKKSELDMKKAKEEKDREWE